jgi:hypothetical protein
MAQKTVHDKQFAKYFTRHKCRKCFIPFVFHFATAMSLLIKLQQKKSVILPVAIDLRGCVMSRRRCPVIIEMERQRLHAGFTVSLDAERAEVSLALREKGWSPFRVWFDAQENAWVALVMYRADVG